MFGQNFIGHGTFVHPQLVLVDDALSDCSVAAKFTGKRFFPSMLCHMEFKGLITGQLFGADRTLKPKISLVFMIPMSREHTPGGKFFLAHITFENTIGLILHVSVIIIEMGPH